MTIDALAFVVVAFLIGVFFGFEWRAWISRQRARRMQHWQRSRQ
jgi:hypothetical protein